MIGEPKVRSGDAPSMAADLDEARSAARQAILAAGELRGELAEMSVQLARARQDQDTFQRRRAMGPIQYLADLIGEYWSAIVRPRLAGVARRVGLRRKG